MGPVKRPRAVGKPARRVRRTLHVEQDVSADGSGPVRSQERLTARQEDADGIVTERNVAVGTVKKSADTRSRT